MGGTYCPRCGKRARRVKGSTVGNYICERCGWFGTEPMTVVVIWHDEERNDDRDQEGSVRGLF